MEAFGKLGWEWFLFFFSPEKEGDIRCVAGDTQAHEKTKSDMKMQPPKKGKIVVCFQGADAT